MGGCEEHGASICLGIATLMRWGLISARRVEQSSGYCRILEHLNISSSPWDEWMGINQEGSEHELGSVQ
eukprot:1141167-Pelagomonas_calceolata.AAC.3